MRLAAPFLSDFVLEPDEDDQDSIGLEWLHAESDNFFDAASMSDGTLRFIALTTLFRQPVELRPKVIVVDEPELGLHPAAICLLAEMIKTAALDSTVIVATQSPPSKRILELNPRYAKVADGTRAAAAVTVATMTEQCRHFADWLHRLEALAHGEVFR